MSVSEHDLCNKRGHVVSYSSDSDGFPDVGRSIGLGNGWHLWIGEITRRDWEEAGEDAAVLGSDFGTWIILYGPNESDKRVIGRAVDNYVSVELLERLSLSMASPSQEAPACV